MTKYQHIKIPTDGSKISFSNGKLNVPDNPVLLFIEGDGTGPDIWNASKMVFDAAVNLAYKGKKKVAWAEVYAGEKSVATYGDNQWLPNETIEAFKEYRVGIKGPLTTPIGGGIRSLNVALRQHLDLYACVRPVHYFKGVPSPVVAPEKVNWIIFRENTEDVYSGIEWQQGTEKAQSIIKFINEQLLAGTGKSIRADSGIGIKPISITGTKRLVRQAIQYAIAKKLSSVTLVHKGNIMKYTEGAFKEWGYELAREEFGDVTVSEDDVYSKYNGKAPAGKVVIKDRIADSMFQQILLRPDEYSVIATPNLNGDYLSDACAAQIGGLGIAPGANIGDNAAVFEATHGTAPKYAGLDKVNPSSVILSGVMMFEHIGWNPVADLIIKGIETTLAQKKVTYDFARLLTGATELKCSQYGAAIVDNMKKLS